MAGEQVERRLMAVLAADVVGNGRLFVSDEGRTPAVWMAQWRELIDPRIVEYGGRIGRMAGHPPLVEFKSAIAAVRCAVEVQRTMLKRDPGRLASATSFGWASMWATSSPMVRTCGASPST